MPSDGITDRICLNSSLYHSPECDYCKQGAGDLLPSVLELLEHHAGFHCPTCRSYNQESSGATEGWSPSLTRRYRHLSRAGEEVGGGLVTNVEH